MSRLAALRAAAVARIAALQSAGVPLFRTVAPHVGRYSVADLKRLLGASPACAVGIVNAARPQRRASGEIALDVTCAAVIVTRAGPAGKPAQPAQAGLRAADDDVLDRAVAVIAAINAWTPAQTVPRVQPADNLHAEGVGDEELDGAGLTVWAVVWTHVVVLGTDDVAADIDAERLLAAPAGAGDWRAEHPLYGTTPIEEGP